jgi:6-phosphogluconate dehydrogenase
MKLGYIGLGKMGYNMVERMLEKGHAVVAWNRSREPLDRIAKEGAIPASDFADLAGKVSHPRLVWIMVAHEAVDAVLDDLLPHLAKGDIVIDGGNSFYKYSMRRGAFLESRGIGFLDVGTSGGPGGARTGACLMIGGEKKHFKRCRKLFSDLAVRKGYAHVGPVGAGHFVKMVHNGIEYGMMQALAEGFTVMKKAPFPLDLGQVAELYNHKSVIESRLVEWLRKAYAEQGMELADVSGKVSQSGEGEWTVNTAKELGIPVPVIEGALQFRIESQKQPGYTGQVLSALRNQFGGHAANVREEK